MLSSLYDKDTEERGIWVFLERKGKDLASVSLELLSKGRELADQVGWHLAGLILGSDIDDFGDDALAYGADEVILIDHKRLEFFTVDAYTYALSQAAEEHRPSVILFGATTSGRDLAGRTAVRMRTGLNADCSELRMEPESGVLVCEVSGFGGGILALIEMDRHRPQMATVRPGVFEPPEKDDNKTGQITQLSIDIPDHVMRTRVLERIEGEGVDLTQAPVLVAGGRGVEDNFDMMRELALLLGGDFGATRPPVDDGYIERERQIGQTGVVCRPAVTVTCGISGAFHFIVGIQESGTVIAINSDPQAAIFDYADYCIVADLHELVPSLIQALRQRSASLVSKGTVDSLAAAV